MAPNCSIAASASFAIALCSCGCSRDMAGPGGRVGREEAASAAAQAADVPAMCWQLAECAGGARSSAARAPARAAVDGAWRCVHAVAVQRRGRTWAWRTAWLRDHSTTPARSRSCSSSSSGACGSAAPVGVHTRRTRSATCVARSVASLVSLKATARLAAASSLAAWATRSCRQSKAARLYKAHRKSAYAVKRTHAFPHRLDCRLELSEDRGQVGGLLLRADALAQ